jgi:signal peptidase complex subunit 3
MHTVWVRLNAVVFFGLTVLLCLSILAALSKYNHATNHQPIITKLALNNMKSLKNHGGVDRALLSFDLQADMTPAFHWNIKQLFVYVIATYKTDTNPKNQIVLWDRIIENTDPPEKKQLNEQNVFVKYGLVDQGAELRGREVELSLHWDHMPLTGTLFVGKQKEGTESTFQLPAEYL